MCLFQDNYMGALLSFRCGCVHHFMSPRMYVKFSAPFARECSVCYILCAPDCAFRSALPGLLLEMVTVLQFYV